jgi:signal transduction histidine kinase
MRIRLPIPRTLAGRVLAVILVGLAVAHVASIFLIWIERADSGERFSARGLAMRVVDDPVRRHEVTDFGELPAGYSPVSPEFRDEVARALERTGSHSSIEWIARAAQGEGRSAVRVALNLGDGRKMLVDATLMGRPGGLPPRAWLGIGVVFFVTAIFSIAAVRLAVQPVRMLADAADRLSRNLDQPPLAESGAQEIHAAARAFNRMQNRLRRHVNGRALAFAAMSHDMRTPLTRMRLRLESLDAGSRAKLSGDLDEIEALTRSVLDMTRTLAPEEEMTRLDLTALVDGITENYATMGQRIPVRGTCEPVQGRPHALRRAFTNLLDNAFKYGSDVGIAIEDRPEHASVTICDRGPGIPAEAMEKVTMPFFRVENSRSRSTGGAGLGLAIAKDIVEGHGGELELRNREDGGLRAIVRLPR